MLSAIMFTLAGIAIGLGLWSGIIKTVGTFTAVYYICAVVCMGLAISLRRFRL